MPALRPPFQSRWMAGFEGASQKDAEGRRIDMVQATQHDEQVTEDYARLGNVGIATVRESLPWHRLERAPRRFDFSLLRPMLRAARSQDIQILWTLCHYGWPDDVDPFSPRFPERLALYAGALATFLKNEVEEPAIHTPINEISFLSWAICDTGLVYPGPAPGRNYELKRQLVRASIAATDAILEVDPRAGIVTIDPIIHVAPPVDRPDLAGRAREESDWQYEAWDMLAGLREPGLGGGPRYLGCLGLNHYHRNQWEFGSRADLAWHLRDPRRIPLSRSLKRVHDRYGAPMIIAETSHVGAGRGAWIEEVAREVGRALLQGVPVEGICLYPAVDRPDWIDPTHWHNSGLWDLVADESGQYRRVAHPPYLRALAGAQELLSPLWLEPSPSLKEQVHVG